MNPASPLLALHVRRSVGTQPVLAQLLTAASRPSVRLPSCPWCLLLQLNIVRNGKSYLAGQPGFEFYVTHLYGSAYDMGYAQGQLYADIAPKLVGDIWSYMEDQVEEAVPFLPTWFSEIIANFGLDVALDMLISLTQPFTGSYFYEELQGLADGSGADYNTLCRIHLIGELTQGDCSMYGAWGPATAGNKTLTMRALDWSTDIPAVQYPQVTVYHPDSGFGHAFA
jgi:hypothetical protein